MAILAVGGFTNLSGPLVSDLLQGVTSPGGSTGASASGEPPNPGVYTATATGFVDGTTVTTVDDLSIKIDVARVVKPDATAANADPSATTASQTVNLVVTTVYGSSGAKVGEKIKFLSQSGEQSDITDAQIAAIENKLDAGNGAVRGVVSIDDHRTTTTTTRESLLEPNAAGKLTTVHQTQTQDATNAYQATVSGTTAFNADTNAAAAAGDIAQNLIDQYTSQTWLDSALPRISATA